MKRTLLSFGILASFFATLLLPVAVSAATMNADKTESGWSDGWLEWNRDGGTASVTNEYGAPEGLGSEALVLSTPLENDKVYVYNSELAGQALADLNTISYYTYRPTASSAPENQVTAINLAVDVNGAAEGGFTTLVFEPVYNTSQGLIVEGQWQEWDAGNQSTWWSSNPIPGAPNRSTFVSLESIKSANPSAVIGYHALNQGGGNQGLVGGADGLTLNDVMYNFEPTAAPAASVPSNLGWTSPTVACGGTTNSNTITANWDDADYAVKYEYWVTTPQRTEATAWTTQVTESSNPGVFNEGEGTYTYKVRAQNADGVWSAYSETCSVVYAITATKPVAPVNKDECKNDGWRNGFQTKYKNQGECVSSIASSGRASTSNRLNF